MGIGDGGWDRGWDRKRGALSNWARCLSPLSFPYGDRGRR